MQAVLPSRTLFGAHHHAVVLLIALLAVCPVLLIGNFRYSPVPMLEVSAAAFPIFYGIILFCE